jgi:hypothetical protein
LQAAAHGGIKDGLSDVIPVANNVDFAARKEAAEIKKNTVDPGELLDNLKANCNAEGTKVLSGKHDFELLDEVSWPVSATLPAALLLCKLQLPKFSAGEQTWSSQASKSI